MKAIVLVLFLLILLGCKHRKQLAISLSPDSLTSKDSIIGDSLNNSADSKQIICDSVYTNKGYRISLMTFDKKRDEAEFNSVFTFEKLIGKKYKQIFKDSIYAVVNEVRFEDFNNDGVKDILIQNFSDVRSNWTFYLYLVDINTESLKKIRGFETIKNPRYIPRYNLVDNLVVSGKDWTSFYKIKGDSIKDFNIVIYRGEDENAFDRDYKKAIRTILLKERDSH